MIRSLERPDILQEGRLGRLEAVARRKDLSRTHHVGQEVDRQIGSLEAHEELEPSRRDLS